MNQSQCENKNKDKKVIEFKYSDLGEGITEGVILSWNVKEGQHVKDQDILLEVENDKLTAEIRSDVSGVVKKYFTMKEII